MAGDRAFFNGKTGREEAWLFLDVRYCELHGREWEEPFWVVTDIAGNGNSTHYAYGQYDEAEADYDARVVRLIRESESGP